MFLNNLTVIITCKDRLDTLKYCIASIKACDSVPRVYIVDFGSKEKFSFPYEWTRVIRVNKNTERFHKARAINIALRKLKTNYVCITDADQIFQPNFFGVVYNTLINNPNSFVMCKTYGLWGHPTNYGVTPENLHENYYKLLDECKKNRGIYGDGCCHASNVKYLIRTHGYDEEFIGWGCEDSDTVHRAMVNKRKLKNINSKTSMIHLPHPHNTNFNGYHSRVIRRKNLALYKKRRKQRIKMANIQRPWGRL